MIHVESLHIYPVKGLPGIEVKQARVQQRGLEYDRRFMLTDANGKFITQRTHPELTQFHISIQQDVISVTHRDVGSISFSAHPLDLSANPNGDKSKSNNALETIIWDDVVTSTSVAPELDTFFSDALKQSIKLVGMPASSHRQADLTYAQEGDSVSFADGFPMLVLGASSIDELNGRLAQPVPINRFRANIIVSGGSPWDEDRWASFETPTCRLRLVKPCARCIVIRTDQQTGQRTDEPMATLLTYRRFDKKVFVGMNAIPDVGELSDTISVGQPIEVSY